MTIPATRDQLLASVHELHPGDVLVLRIDPSYNDQHLDWLREDLAAGLEGTGVRALVLRSGEPLEHYRPVESEG